MKLIHGPEDVAVGDLVQFEVGNHHRRGHMEGRVTAVRDESLSVRVEPLGDFEPRVRTIKMWREVGSRYRGTKFREHLIFKMEPVDLWLREKPAGFDLRPSGIMNRRDLAEIDVDSLLTMTPEEASAKLRAFVEWLKRRPS